MENFNMLVLQAIMWRRSWRRKRRNMWVHQKNIKRPDFEIFSYLYPDPLEDKEKFHVFFRMNIEQFYRLSQLVGEEIQKQSTKYMRAIAPEERLAIFEVRAIKVCRRQESDSRYYWSYTFS